MKDDNKQVDEIFQPELLPKTDLKKAEDDFSEIYKTLKKLKKRGSANE